MSLETQESRVCSEIPEYTHHTSLRTLLVLPMIKNVLANAIFKLVKMIVGGNCRGSVPSLRSLMANVAHHTESVLHVIASLQRPTPNIFSESCSHDRVLDHGGAAPGIEPGTSRTQTDSYH